MMADEAKAAIPAGGLEVVSSAAGQVAKGQLRLLIAATAGALVAKGLLPASLANDPVIDAVTGLVIFGVASAWSARRAIVNHARLLWLARSRRVPNDMVRPKG